MKNLELDQRKKIDTQRFRDRSNIVTIVPASIIELIEGENQVINSIKTITSSNLKCYYTAVLLIIMQLLLLTRSDSLFTKKNEIENSSNVRTICIHNK